MWFASCYKIVIKFEPIQQGWIMETQVKLINQRAFTRFRVKKLAFAMMVNSAILFQLVDISKNGLSFSYIGREKWFDDFPELDVLIYGHDFYLKGFPIISVSDFTLDNSCLPMRRHSVMFHKLNPVQQTQLYHFILYYTEGKA